ncbi:MAG: ribonuclease E/G [Lachnospira sp.]
MNTKYIITDFKDKCICARYDDSVCGSIKVLDNGSIRGNIYVGRVENVVKNLHAAFVEINKGVKCFYSLDDNKKHIFLNQKNNEQVNIGDKILVSISVDAFKTKPATCTSKIELSGKFLVISNDVSGVSISKKCKSDEKCRDFAGKLAFLCKSFVDRLNARLNPQFPFNLGFILRSNAKNASEEEITEEATQLYEEYERIFVEAVYGTFFANPYKHKPEYVDECIHLLADSNVEIITDNPEYKDTLDTYLGQDCKNVRFYNDELLPLYNLYDIRKTLEHALSKNVWLKCGGYIVIEQTEALTVVDVNSGKNICKSNDPSKREQTYLKTNIEAAEELMRQIRLRNISGIIVVDFINMEKEENVSELMLNLKKHASEDPVTTTVVDMTKLGLVEITRRKNGKTLKENFDV